MVPQDVRRSEDDNPPDRMRGGVHLSVALQKRLLKESRAGERLKTNHSLMMFDVLLMNKAYWYPPPLSLRQRPCRLGTKQRMSWVDESQARLIMNRAETYDLCPLGRKHFFIFLPSKIWEERRQLKLATTLGHTDWQLDSTFAAQFLEHLCFTAKITIPLTTSFTSAS